jgi:heat shock protein HslJ
VPDPENYMLAFFPDSTYYIKADCNSGSGNYFLEQNVLTLAPPVMTLIACGPESMYSEYLSLLSNVNSATLENGQLILYSESTGLRMFFTKGGRIEQKI